MKRLLMTVLAANAAVVPVAAEEPGTAPSPADQPPADQAEQQPEVSMELSVQASQQTAEVGDTVSLLLRPLDSVESTGDLYAMLRSPDASATVQERFLHFSYDEQEHAWKADYTVTAYDQPGEWTLDVYGGHALEDVKVLQIHNEEPRVDTEPPQLVDLLLPDKMEVMEGRTLQASELKVKAKDEGSGVRSITVALVNEESMDTERTLQLRWQEDNTWTADIAEHETLRAGTYKIVYTMVDHTGNAVHEIAKQQLQIVSREPQPKPSELLQPKPETKPSEKTHVQPKPAQMPVKKPAQTVAAKKMPAAVKAVRKPAAKTYFVKKELSNPAAAVLKSAQKAQQKHTAASQPKQSVPAQQENKPSASTMFGYVAGVFLLLSVFKHNKDWAQES
ncbi:hypothetical protein [Ectobacillus ponti]|uniref:Uncharacterized protein n=1 Tax=Ectobacillus ponti TaxID=2961894 RepID=A0AA42BP83_9BACI|nr:hypothetical protein [Ectobacillus ponti]MCP8968830.1 hypothetical protein [Ectobacillus ponti]